MASSIQAQSDTSDTRFPRTAAVLEAARAADVLRTCASALDTLAADSPRYDPATLRLRARKLRHEAAQILLGMALVVLALAVGGCAGQTAPAGALLCDPVAVSDDCSDPAGCFAVYQCGQAEGFDPESMGAICEPLDDDRFSCFWPVDDQLAVLYVDGAVRVLSPSPVVVEALFTEGAPQAVEGATLAERRQAWTLTAGPGRDVEISGIPKPAKIMVGATDFCPSGGGGGVRPWTACGAP